MFFLKKTITWHCFYEKKHIRLIFQISNAEFTASILRKLYFYYRNTEHDYMKNQQGDVQLRVQ